MTRRELVSKISVSRRKTRAAIALFTTLALALAPTAALAAKPSLSIANKQVTEGDDGTTPARVKVTLSKKSTKVVKVDYKTVDRSAKAGEDYVAKEGTLKFPVGTKAKTISVLVMGDTKDEKNETFLVKLSNPRRAAIEDGTAKVKIIDNDDPPTVSIEDSSLLEGNTGSADMSFDVTLSQASGKRIFVDYATTDGTATGPGDYQGASGTVEFVPGDTTKTVDIAVNGDELDEENETFTVTLLASTNSTLEDDTATGTITDDDGEPTVSIANAEDVTEGSNLEFPVTLAPASGREVTVNYAVTLGTGTEAADAQHPLPSGTLTFVPGDTSETIVVSTTNDTIDEDDESITVTLSAATNAELGTPTASGTINDNDAAPTVTIGSSGAAEGGNVVFTVFKSGLTEKTVTVEVSTALDTTNLNTVARAVGGGTDYQSKTDEVVTFLPGQNTQGFTVTTVQDTIDELDETFLAVLSDPGNATLGTPSQNVGTIVDDDPAPVVTIQGRSINEGDAESVTISMNRASSRDVTFGIQYISGPPGPNGAQAGSDYTVTNHGTVTIAAGSTSTTITVTTVEDSVDEANEIFTMRVLSPVNASAGTDATITIVDDD